MVELFRLNSRPVADVDLDQQIHNMTFLEKRSRALVMRRKIRALIG